jgi:hypothetical protein
MIQNWPLVSFSLTLIIGSNDANHWAPKGDVFAVALLAAFAAMARRPCQT